MYQTLRNQANKQSFFLAFLLLLMHWNSAYALTGQECLKTAKQNLESEAGRSSSQQILSLEDQTPERIQVLQKIRHKLEKIQLEERDLKKAFQRSENSSQTDLPLLKNKLSLIREQRKNIEYELASAEEDLRTIRTRLIKSIDNRRYCDATKIRHESYLIDVENYFMIPEHDRLYIDHNDYEHYFFKLSVGYEYTSISKILEESSPRIALLIFSHFGNRPYRDKYGLGYYGFQMFGNLTLSGASEQKQSSSGADEANSTETLGIDVSVFSAILRHKMRPDLSHQFGPIFSLGAKQTDESKNIRARAYAGVRSTMTPEHYIDALLGRSPGLDSVRLEIRGQLPVVRLKRGSRMFVGTVMNMAVANKQDDEEDLLTVYFSWNIDFLDLFTTGG